MSRGKKAEVAALRRELAGEREIRLSRLAPDGGTDEGERRQQLIWQHFRLKRGTSANAVVLGDAHPDFIDDHTKAAAANTAELFESELIKAGSGGVALDRLASVHAHYFGAGFERCVGTKLRRFVKERFETDERTGCAKAPVKLLDALRKLETRELLRDEQDFQQKQKEKSHEEGKRKREPPPPGFGLSTGAVGAMPGAAGAMPGAMAGAPGAMPGGMPGGMLGGMTGTMPGGMPGGGGFPGVPGFPGGFGDDPAAKRMHMGPPMMGPAPTPPFMMPPPGNALMY